MKTLFIAIFLFWGGILPLQAQKATFKEQKKLKIVFEQFKKNFDNTVSTWNLGLLHWYTNECPFYQLKWIKNTDDDNSKNYTVEKGDNSCLCEKGQKQHKFSASGTFFSVRGKYAIIIPMSKNAKEYYFEMDEKQEMLKNQFVKDIQAQFEAYIVQMQKASDFPDFKENPEFAKECHLYQLKWAYFCMPGGQIFVQKGEQGTFCDNPVEIKRPNTHFRLSTDRKYAILEHSVPMGTCDDAIYYYERIE